MALNSFAKFANLNTTGNNALHSPHPIEIKRINGVFDIVNDVDVILFSAHNTLIKNKMTLPAGAVAVPRLRQENKKLAVFSVDEDLNKQDITRVMNYLGFSFSQERVLNSHDLNNLETRFPLYPPQRILMVCSDVMTEVSLGRQLGFKTLLVSPDLDETPNQLGILPDYVALSV